MAGAWKGGNRARHLVLTGQDSVGAAREDFLLAINHRQLQMRQEATTLSIDDPRSNWKALSSHYKWTILLDRRDGICVLDFTAVRYSWGGTWNSEMNEQVSGFLNRAKRLK